MSGRIAKLQKFLALDPSDGFARYALALEHKKLGQSEEAEREFRHLLEHSPEYCAGYYHFAAMLKAQGRSEEAKTVIDEGLTRSRAAQELNTAKELEELREGL